MKSVHTFAHALALVSIVALAACGDDPGPMGPPLPVPEFRQATVTANPINTISATVEVGASLYESAFLRFWSPGGVAHRSPDYEFDGDTLVTASALGLRFDTTYSIEVNLRVGNLTEAVDTLSFTTGSQPGWIPQGAGTGANPTEGYLALSYPGGPVIIDNSGRVVWYLSLSGSVSLSSFQAHPNGLYTLSNASEAFRVLDELGRDVDLITCVNRETRFHEIRVELGGDYWIMCNDEQVMDLTGIGGMSNVNTIWTVIQHVSADGSLLFEWNSFDHFEITDNPLPNLAQATIINVTHGNSLLVGPDGNLIVSFRELGEITKIDLATGAVIWRFGGLANQFTLLGDPKGSFEGQHGLALLENGELQFLDNGLVAPSRLVRYRLDEQALTATFVMEFIDSPTTYTPVGGSTQAYGNGNGLVSFGRGGRVVETTATGARAWELTGIDGNYVFRAQRIPSLYSAELGGPVP